MSLEISPRVLAVGRPAGGTRRSMAGGFCFRGGKERAAKRVAIQMARPRRSCSCMATPRHVTTGRRGRAISGTASHDRADFLGFGLSDKPEAFGYSLFQQADMIEGCSRQLAIVARISSATTWERASTASCWPGRPKVAWASSCERRHLLMAGCCNGWPKSRRFRSYWPATPRCRRRSTFAARSCRGCMSSAPCGD